MSMDRRESPSASRDEAALDALLAKARAEAPPPLAEGLRARLVEAALAESPAVQARPLPWWSRVRAALAEFGGAPSLASLGVAGLAGLWIGFAAPGPAADLMGNVWPDVWPGASAGIDWLTETDLGFDDIELLTLLDSETE